VTERLRRPDIKRFPDLKPGDVRVLAAGTDLGRIYASGGDYPTTWNGMRAFGPTRCRFDPHPLPPGPHPTRRVMHATPAIPGPHGRVYPVLKTCLAECFRDTGVVDTTREDPYLAIFPIVRDLRLLDLGDSDWVTRAHGNAAISSGPRARSREWARAIHQRYVASDDIDGVIYPSSNIPVARSVALWEPAETALPAAPDFNDPLSHAGLLAALETYAVELDLGLVV
jgi:hypothetical protein